MGREDPVKKKAEIGTNRAGEELETWKDEGFWPNMETKLDNKFFRADPFIDASKKRIEKKIKSAIVKRAVLEYSGDSDGGYNGMVDAYRQGQGYPSDGYWPEGKPGGTDGKVNRGPRGFAGNFVKAVEKKRNKNVRK